MSDNDKKFHEFALQSALFKGRTDQYFCFLKAEKIARVLLILAKSVPVNALETVDNLSGTALGLPSTIAHFAAGEVDAPVLLADIFSLISAVRLAGVRGSISTENALILAQEYERLAEKLSTNMHLSPFVSADDFAVPQFGQQDALRSLPASVLGVPPPTSVRQIVKDNKGRDRLVSQGQQERSSKILDFILVNKRVSIKDITAVVRNCSEKTVQRELTGLIQQGLIKKVGERRWSLYLPT